MGLALRRAIVCLAGPCLLGGCVGVPATFESYKLPIPPQGIVLVVEGAGGEQTSSRAVAAAVAEAGLPLYVRSFDWTHGRGRVLADMTDIGHARAQAYRLAGQINWYRTTNPGAPLYVIAHSTGALVALEAAQWLTPDSIERLILFAPAVSAGYDLRRALVASRLGVDVYSSERDRFWLPTADGKSGALAAGQIGFDTPAPVLNDPALSRRLRQHPWDPVVAWTGNAGDHSGSLRPTYLKAYVLPLLRS